jgi:bifunctional DNA-binding transcriptional regulator/antitoxin component of YhaV-PrlF toxin-antitoxin module
MLAELFPKSQITLPDDIVAKIGLSTGDMLDISEKEGIVLITPVATSKKHLSREEYLEVLGDLYGSIDDPAFVEQEEIMYEASREKIF